MVNGTDSPVPKGVSNCGSVSNVIHLPLCLVSMNIYGFLMYMLHCLGGSHIHHEAEDETVRNWQR